MISRLFVKKNLPIEVIVRNISDYYEFHYLNFDGTIRSAIAFSVVRLIMAYIPGSPV